MKRTTFSVATLLKKSISARSAYTAGIILLLISIGYAKESEAVVRTGVDSLVVDGGFDFSAESHLIRYYSTESDDFQLAQIQDRHTVYAYEGGLQADEGIRDMGPVPFDSLVMIPEDLEPDPSTALRDSQTGELFRWSVPFNEGHLYVIWTREGHFAKIFVHDIIRGEGVWADFIRSVIFRWAYQDDGSRSLDTDSAVSKSSWGLLKFLIKGE